MKAIHVNAGNEYGGGLVHIISLLSNMKSKGIDCELIVLEEGPVAEAARTALITVHVFKQSSRYDIRVIPKLTGYINSSDADVVHAHGPRANMLLSMISPFIRIKWISTIHSNPYLDFKNMGLKGKIFEKINMKSLKRSDGIIAVSREIADIAKKIGVNPNKVEIIHNGIDFSEPLSSKKDKNVFTIISVGRLHKIKNYSLLIRTLSYMKVEDWKLIICGDGEEEKELCTLVKKFSLSSKIEFRGWLDSDMLKSLISQSDILVHPSLSESFPLVLLEAAEQSIPVISSDVGDVSCLIKEERISWLIKPDSEKELEQAINEAYSLWKDNKLSIIGKRLREEALSFSLSNQSDEVVSFYKKVTTK